MVRLVRQGGTQGCLPVRQALPGGSVDKIHRGRQARFLRPLNDEGNPLGRMRAIQGREDLRHSRLHAKGHSSKPSVSQLRESITRHRVGVSFEGHLRTRRNTDAFTQACEDLGQLIDIQHRRSTATEKYRPRLARGEPRLGHDPRRQSSLGKNGGRVVPHLRARTETDRVRVEVAIPTAHATKRDVHIQGEGTTAIRLDEAGVERSVGWPALTLRLGGAHRRAPRLTTSATGTTNADDVMGMAPGIDTARLKVRDDTSLETRGESSTLRLRITRIRSLPGVRVVEKLAGLDHVSHLPRIVVPVGGQAPRSAIAQQACHLEGKRIGHQATLTMSGLAPRIGEERPDLVQARVPQHDGKGLSSIGFNHADVINTRVDRLGHELGDARNPHLKGEEVTLGMGSRSSDDLLARARANLERHGSAASKQLSQIEREILRDRRVANAATRLDHIAVRVRLPRAREVRGQFARASRERLRAAHEDRALGSLTRTTTPGLIHPILAHFLPVGTSEVSAAMKASCGTSTRPMDFMRFLPSFCFSSSLRLRLMSPP